jgi:pyruvate dehydrogenase E2 component (dihydrolipoamide acetyltransferase)
MEEQILTPIIGSEDGQAVLSTWGIKIGDKITVGQIIGTIETNKAVLELESTKNGVVKELLVSQGAEIADLQPIVTVVIESELNG